MSDATAEPTSASSGSPPQGKPFNELTEEERVEFIPQQIFDFKKSDPAFLFSRDNLRTIKRYQSAVSRLPTTREGLAGDINLDALGLKVDDILRFYTNLHAHGNAWDDVEDACKKMGSDLQVFAEEFITEGVKFISKLKTTAALDSGLDQLPEEASKSIPLSDVDHLAFKEAVDLYLDAILSSIREELRVIGEVKQLIDHFGDQITTNLSPTARGLLEHLAKESLDSKIANIGTQLILLDGMIEQKASEYDSLVGAAFYGLAFGPAGLAVSGGIYGAKAEAVRAEKNDLIVKRDALIKQQSDLGEGLAHFQALKKSVMDISFRLVEVRAATANLEDVWVLLESYMNSSMKKVDAITTNVQLKKFVVQFERVVSPWRHILNISKSISEIFNAVIKDPLEEGAP